jgi:hypothetical protein
MAEGQLAREEARGGRRGPRPRRRDRELPHEPPSEGRPIAQGRHALATPTRVGEHRREAERAVADVGGSDLGSFSDTELDAAIDQLAAIEARVSRSRRSVHAVIDSLTDEVARRYTADHSLLAHSLP